LANGTDLVHYYLSVATIIIKNHSVTGELFRVGCIDVSYILVTLNSPFEYMWYLTMCDKNRPLNYVNSW